MEQAAPSAAGESVQGLPATEQRLRALYAISDLASAQLDQAELLRDAHRIVASLMFAENFLVALYDRHRRVLRFACFVDQHDREAPEPDAEFRAEDLPNSLTLAVIERGIALRGSSAKLTAELGFQYDLARGPDSLDWLGVPMIADGVVHGAVVVQSYDQAGRYGESEQSLLSFVAQHVLTALIRRRTHEHLESQVIQRTGELEDANRQLKTQVREREAGERLQAALFRIAEITSSASSVHDFYAAVHAVVGELLYAKNFFIALSINNGEAFEFPYAVDELDPGALFAPRARRRGLTEYVLRSGQPLLALRRDIDDLISSGEVETIGSLSVCWLGVPLIQDGVPCGAIVVQSYSPDVIYTSRDQELLTFVSFHIATALQRREAQESLKRANAELELRVQELHRAQRELIESEKMASLGRLVAGVAHEVNTPLGISVTAISFLRAQLADLRAKMRAEQAERLLGPIEHAAAMTETNLQRAANLVRTFKQVAVDQSASSLRSVDVREYLEGSLLSLSPALRQAGHRVELDCPAGIRLRSRPDALHQILANLVMNSLMHGYPDGRSGTLRIRVRAQDGMLHLRYQDDGVGMDREVASHLFEPFYTTRRDQGGTGLGMHIVYNLVHQALGGRIQYQAAEAGVCFDIRVPSVYAPSGAAGGDPG